MPLSVISSMADEELTLTGFLRAMPKVEIHCHLLGTVRYATFVELAERSRARRRRDGRLGDFAPHPRGDRSWILEGMTQ